MKTYIMKDSVRDGEHEYLGSPYLIEAENYEDAHDKAKKAIAENWGAGSWTDDNYYELEYDYRLIVIEGLQEIDKKDAKKLKELAKKYYLAY